MSDETESTELRARIAGLEAQPERTGEREWAAQLASDICDAADADDRTVTLAAVTAERDAAIEQYRGIADASLVRDALIASQREAAELRAQRDRMKLERDDYDNRLAASEKARETAEAQLAAARGALGQIQALIDEKAHGDMSFAELWSVTVEDVGDILDRAALTPTETVGEGLPGAVRCQACIKRGFGICVHRGMSAKRSRRTPNTPTGER